MLWAFDAFIYIAKNVLSQIIQGKHLLEKNYNI